jgi:polyisoprenoid-binding protein YceI
MTVATTTKWALDTTHTEIQFKVKHLVISTVTGFFKKFSGSVESNGDSFDGASVEFEADVDSLDTNNTDRDNHLKSPDFFAADQYPTLKFSGVLRQTSNDHYKLEGDLTLRGVTKPVVLEATSGGTMKDPWGNTKAGFEINGVINRKEFGLNWNALTEAGGMVVSEDVKLHVNAELAKQ